MVEQAIYKLVLADEHLFGNFSRRKQNTRIVKVCVVFFFLS